MRDLEKYLKEQSALPYSYPGVGGTRDGAIPAGYDHDVNRVRLGSGEKVFDGACAALRRWEMFPKPWTKIIPGGAPICEGTAVAVLTKVCGIWWLNAARIVYAFDEAASDSGKSDAAKRRFGFAYGTLPGHCERGEERFCIEWRADDSVWYAVEAFSRPRLWLARLAYPLARRAQRRFVKESKAAMLNAVMGMED